MYYSYSGNANTRLPIIVTEQYVKGLGQTIPMLQEAIDSYNPIEKMNFSCCGVGAFNLKIEDHYKENIIICGIESYVCVLQTALDLLEAGYKPIVLV
jgi:nicotinamidase-related amidase